MYWAPGSRKNNDSKRIPTILPDLSFEEALEVTKIHSISGMLSKDVPIIINRPFRAPHHTISPKSLIGGGLIPKTRRSKSITLWYIVFR